MNPIINLEELPEALNRGINIVINEHGWDDGSGDFYA